MTNAQIAKLQKLNDSINQLKREVKEMINAPVVESIYSDEANQYSDDTFVLQSSEIWTILPGEVTRLAQLCNKRQSILSK